MCIRDSPRLAGLPQSVLFALPPGVYLPDRNEWCAVTPTEERHFIGAKKMRSISIAVLLLFCGCSAVRVIDVETHLKSEVCRDLVARARIHLLTRINFTEEEKQTVLSTEPAVLYACLAGQSYAHYALTWNFSGNRQVSLGGDGDITSDKSFNLIIYGECQRK